MKKRFGAVASALFIGVALYLYFHSQKPALTVVAPSTENTAASQTGGSPSRPGVSPANTGSNSSKEVSSEPQTQPAILAASAGQVVPDSSPVPDLPPETVLENVRRAIHQYGEMFGGNPVGTNPEITSQLSGENPKHINFIAAQPGMRINAEGELIDAWGTPYFFHQISGEETEVHSAGPDKVMWTSDDLVVK